MGSLRDLGVHPGSATVWLSDMANYAPSPGLCTMDVLITPAFRGLERDAPGLLSADDQLCDRSRIKICVSSHLPIQGLA